MYILLVMIDQPRNAWSDSIANQKEKGSHKT